MEEVFRVPKAKKPEHWPGRYKPVFSGQTEKLWFPVADGVQSNDFLPVAIPQLRWAGECCKTQKEAEFLSRQRGAYLELIDLIQELNEWWRPDCANGQVRCYLMYNHYENKVDIGTETGTVQTRPDCEYLKPSIDSFLFHKIKEDKIKLALWGIE